MFCPRFPLCAIQNGYAKSQFVDERGAQAAVCQDPIRLCSVPYGGCSESKRALSCPALFPLRVAALGYGQPGKAAYIAVAECDSIRIAYQPIPKPPEGETDSRTGNYGGFTLQKLSGSRLENRKQAADV